MGKLVDAGCSPRLPLTDGVAAISCGVCAGAVLDLDYAEDSSAQTDANFVLTGAGGIVEIQATAEGARSTRRASRRCWRWPAPASPS